MLGGEMYGVGAVPCNITAAGFSTSTGEQVAEQVATYEIQLLDLSMPSPKGTFAAACKGLGGIALEVRNSAATAAAFDDFMAVLMGR